MVLKIIKRLYQKLGKVRKWHFFGLLALTLFASLFEIISLGAVVPLIAIVTQPDRIFEYFAVQQVASILNFKSADDLVGPIVLFFIAVSLFTGLLRIFLLYQTIKFSNLVGADLSADLFSNAIQRPYPEQLERHSSEVMSATTQKSDTATAIIASLITLITNGFLFVGVLTAILLVDFTVSVIAVGMVGLIYITIYSLSRKILVHNSAIIAELQTKVVKISQESMGSIRNVIIDNNYSFYIRVYSEFVYRLQKVLGINQFITLAPRYMMEGIALGLIGLYIYLARDNSTDLVSKLPTIGALALGAQRLLPIAQQFNNNFGMVAGNKQSVLDVLEFLDLPKTSKKVDEAGAALEFCENIIFKNVSFRYSNEDRFVIKDFNLSIPKGSTLGIIGPTGSGKSTLIDIFLGLFSPTSGELQVDGVAINSKNLPQWQKIISHVPQEIFLTDASISENIALGTQIKDIDDKKIHLVGNIAQLNDFVAKLPDGYEAVVGEQGAKLSGGQRQRIGIARALFKTSTILVLDEATSALDRDTENSIMEVLGSKNSEITVIMISHRVETLKNCDQIVRLNGDGTYKKVKYTTLIDVS